MLKLKILIVGGNGILGRAFADMLECSFDVFTLDVIPNNSVPKPATLGSQFKFLAEKSDLIIMLNGQSRLAACENDIPLAIQRNVLDNAIYFDILKQINFRGRVVVASSLYADFGSKTVYGLTKVQMEQVAQHYIEKFSLKIDIIRLGSVYGDLFDTNSLPIHLLRGGATRRVNKNITREYVFVQDVVNLVMSIATNEYKPITKRIRMCESHDLRQLMNCMPERLRSRARKAIEFQDSLDACELQYLSCLDTLENVQDVFVQPAISLKENLNKISRQAVFFDFDGTILDSANAKLQAFFEIYELYGALNEETMAYLKENVGLPRHFKLGNLNKILNNKIDKDTLHKEFEKILCDKLKNAHLLPGAKAYLKKLYNLGIPLYIISAAPDVEVMKYLQHFKILEYFKEVLCDSNNKAIQLAEIIEKERIDISYSRYYGDSKTDYDASLANNLNYINVGDSLPIKSVPNFMGLL